MSAEKFCKDCVHYEDALNGSKCIDREDAISLVTGDIEKLHSEAERNDVCGTINKLVSAYKPCGPEGRHWMEKHE